MRGLSIWVDNRQFPQSEEYWDSNWLNVRIVAEAPGARVKCSGSLLMTTDFAAFRDRLEVLHRTLQGEARLEGLEPNLKVSLRATSLGHVEAEVEIRPDGFESFHRFSYSLDQSYLPSLIHGCEEILERFPIKDWPA